MAMAYDPEQWTHWTIPLDGTDVVHVYFPRSRFPGLTDEDWAYFIENFELMRKWAAKHRERRAAETERSGSGEEVAGGGGD
jgi:hypothetical protein